MIMVQKSIKRDESEAATSGKGSRETMAGRQVFDFLSQVVPFSQGLMISMLPRGSIHIVQPGKCPETMLKAYVRDHHKEDRVAWQAILRGQAVRAADCWSAAEFNSSPYLHGMLQPHGLRYSVGVPLAAPVLNGYPGAVVLFRGPDEGEFEDSEVSKLRNIGREVDEFISKSRQTRNTELAVNTDPWTHNAPIRQFIFNKDAKAIFPKKDLGLESRVQEQLVEHARKALETSKRGQHYAERLLLPDGRGDLWVFHCEVHKDFPALGQGPVVIFCLQPEAFEWVAVRPSDLAADAELVRLLPTLKFMQQEFPKNPTLDDIARKAHLSPFHFHRRFTDLIGQTPKHFLLSCQIHEAKRALAARRRELAQIATDCGFAHQSHFTSRFKQATGLTPTRWRRLAAEIVRSGVKH
jgi:AraC-like DNA-binding protein